MEPVMWAFSGDKDVDADVKMMLEIRSELNEELKAIDRILAVHKCSVTFNAECLKLASSSDMAKAQLGWFWPGWQSQN